MYTYLCICVCVSITVYHSTVYSQQQNSNETLNNEDLVRNISVILTLQRGVAITARHSINITCRGVTSPARHAARSHSFVYISTS